MSVKPPLEAAPRARSSYPPELVRRGAAAREPNVVIVCEHATNAIPPEFGGLGLAPELGQSHIAWDPGALGVAREMSRLLDADLVFGSVSRLLYDCNRPPEAPSATPELSELFEIPGNKGLTQRDREARTLAIYEPFRSALAALLDELGEGFFVTVHSFTPVFHGVRRSCEIGILHDADSLLADALLAAVPPDFPFKVERNVPYSARDGVTHTLQVHAVPRGWPNVMLEIRNDLIDTKAQQADMAHRLVALLSEAISSLKASVHG